MTIATRISTAKAKASIAMPVTKQPKSVYLGEREIAALNRLDDFHQRIHFDTDGRPVISGMKIYTVDAVLSLEICLTELTGGILCIVIIRRFGQ